MEPQISTSVKRTKWHSKKKLIEPPKSLSVEYTDLSTSSSQNPTTENSYTVDESSVLKTDTLIQPDSLDSKEEAKENAQPLDLTEDLDIYSTENPSTSYYSTEPQIDLNELSEHSTDINKIQYKESNKSQGRIPPTKGYTSEQKLNHNIKNTFEEYKLSTPLYAGDENSSKTGKYAPESKVKSKYSMSDLKKDPELFKKAYAEALRLEREQGRDYTYFGDKIVVTGGHEMLGNWDPSKGLELEWNQGNIWSSTIHVGEGQLFDIEYKYVCLQGAGTIRWEGGFNRKLKVSEGKPKGDKLVFELNDVWQR